MILCQLTALTMLSTNVNGFRQIRLIFFQINAFKVEEIFVPFYYPYFHSEAFYLEKSESNLSKLMRIRDEPSATSRMIYDNHI